VSPWKVILATLVIFIAGLITGAVMVKQFGPSPGTRTLSQSGPVLPGPLREEFVRRMAIELKLTPEQKDKILSIVHESQERTKLLYSLIGEDVRDEMRQTREAIREQLTPDQSRRFEEMMRLRERRLSGLRNDKLEPGPGGNRSRGGALNKGQRGPGGEPPPSTDGSP
jgi:hypothetical protein